MPNPWGDDAIATWPDWNALCGGELGPIEAIEMEETYVTTYQGAIYGVDCEYYSTLDGTTRLLVVRRYYRDDKAPGWWVYDHIATEDVTAPELAIAETMAHLPDRLLEWLL